MNTFRAQSLDMAQKILLIRFSSIGDIVLTTPVIRCLKQQLDNVEIHYLTKSSFASVLTANPYIHKLHTIDKDVSECMEKLKLENFDHIIDLHNNLRTAILKRGLRKPKVACCKLQIQPLASHPHSRQIYGNRKKIRRDQRRNGT